MIKKVKVKVQSQNMSTDLVSSAVFPNTKEVRNMIKQLRLLMPAKYFTIICRGRHSNRKALYEKLGKTYLKSKHGSVWNEVPIKYAETIGVYIRLTEEHPMRKEYLSDFRFQYDKVQLLEKTVDDLKKQLFVAKENQPTFVKMEQEINRLTTDNKALLVDNKTLIRTVQEKEKDVKEVIERNVTLYAENRELTENPQISLRVALLEELHRNVSTEELMKRMIDSGRLIAVKNSLNAVAEKELVKVGNEIGIKFKKS